MKPAGRFKLQPEDGGVNYCFLVEDSSGKQAVASRQIAYPLIEVEQNNDQLRAVVVNENSDNITIDDKSWRWFRYKHVEDSRFGCQPENQSLNSDQKLKQAAEVAMKSQVASGLESPQDVYSIQKQVYSSGQGSIIDLTPADTGLTYCFQVADTAGITNSGQALIGEVVITEVPGAKSTIEDQSTVSNQDFDQDLDLDKIKLSNSNQTDSGNEVNQDNQSNWVRNLGYVLLGLALVIGAVLFVQKFQVKDKDSESADF